MFNRQTPLRLSFQDKYILGFESESIAFNSHLVIELDAEFDSAKLSNAFSTFIKLEPFARIVPDVQTGKFYLQPFEEVKVKKQCQVLSNSDLTDWWNRPFNFEQEYTIRMLLVPAGNASKIVFSFHHAVFDGHAQINFLKDFFDIYRGSHYEARELQSIYRFRKYFYQTKFLWIFNFLGGLFKHKKKYKEKVKIARLFDREPISRNVAVKVVELDRSFLDKGSRKLALSTSAYVSLIGAKTMDMLLSERGIVSGPIVLFITKSMRFELKCLRAYQNLVGFIWMKIPRKEIQEKSYSKTFRETYKFRSSDDEVRKTLLTAALMVKLVSFEKLKNLLTKKEKKVHDCTLIVSSGRTPAEVQFPEDLQIKSLIARGTMHRSPGIGLMVTSFKNKDFITIEYLEDAFEQKTIERFAELLQINIQDS